jgi:soluble lytic murein transglycosylase
LVLVGVTAVLSVAFLLWWQTRRENRFDREIRAAATRYRLPGALVKAIIWRESDFNPSARGGKGEIGLMQLMDFTAQDWADANRVPHFTHEHVLNPTTNTLAGCHYLARLLKRYGQTDNPLAYTLADYNAGRGNVLKWMKGAATTNSSAFLAQCEFPTTRNYVVTILKRSERYRTQFD